MFVFLQFHYQQGNSNTNHELLCSTGALHGQSFKSNLSFVLKHFLNSISVAIFDLEEIISFFQSLN